jgi:hypothetical protein
MQFSRWNRPIALEPVQPRIERLSAAKRMEREADLSPPSGTEVKRTWIWISAHITSILLKQNGGQKR